jgi:hypothetical protein
MCLLKNIQTRVITFKLTPTILRVDSIRKVDYIVTLNESIDTNYDYTVKLNNILTGYSE